MIRWLFTMALTLQGCLANQNACDRDNFFCNKRDDWEKSASNEPISRLLELHVISYQHLHAPTSAFAHVLGDRGAPVVPEIIKLMEAHRDLRDWLLIMPIIDSLESRSHYDICSSSEYKKLFDIMLDSGRSSENRTELNKRCLAEAI